MFSPLALTTQFQGTRARGKTKGLGVRQRIGIHPKSFVKFREHNIEFCTVKTNKSSISKGFTNLDRIKDER